MEWVEKFKFTTESVCTADATMMMMIFDFKPFTLYAANVRSL